jgi:F0F1-type ATP synthase membrane subunit b/b'
MNFILVILINIILIFIIYVVLNNKIKKSSAPKVLETYAREVDNLIVELNEAVDNAVNISEDRVRELKRCIRKAERLLKDPTLEKLKTSMKKKEVDLKKEKEITVEDNRNLIDKAKHLFSMGHTKEDVAKHLNISRSEVEFLKALNRE